MTYILIVLGMIFNNHNLCNEYTYDIKCPSQSQVEARASYLTFKNKGDLADSLKNCKDNSDCNVVAVLGCDWNGCKEYSYDLNTQPNIKNSVDLKEAQ